MNHYDALSVIIKHYLTVGINDILRRMIETQDEW